jgi:hypothetical protein
LSVRDVVSLATAWSIECSGCCVICPLKRISKGKPLKKVEETDAIFANVRAVRAEACDDPGTLELSMDTKAKVALGEYVRGGKNPDRLRR